MGLPIFIVISAINYKNQITTLNAVICFFIVTIVRIIQKGNYHSIGIRSDNCECLNKNIKLDKEYSVFSSSLENAYYYLLRFSAI